MGGKAKRGPKDEADNYRFLAADLKGRKVEDIILFNDNGHERVMIKFTGGLSLRMDPNDVFDHEGWHLDYTGIHEE